MVTITNKLTDGAMTVNHVFTTTPSIAGAYYIVTTLMNQNGTTITLDGTSANIAFTLFDTYTSGTLVYGVWVGLCTASTSGGPSANPALSLKYYSFDEIVGCTSAPIIQFVRSNNTALSGAGVVTNTVPAGSNGVVVTYSVTNLPTGNATKKSTWTDIMMGAVNGGSSQWFNGIDLTSTITNPGSATGDYFLYTMQLQVVPFAAGIVPVKNSLGLLGVGV